jgi:hypothetical protein
LDAGVRYRIEEVGVDGTPAPEEVYTQFVKSCGVIVRDNVPITIQEWNRPSGGGVPYVGDVVKTSLFRKLMVNFLLPVPDVDDPDEMEKAQDELESRIMKFALIKMAEAFKNYKKDLDRKFIKKGKTPDFTRGYAKLRHHWDDFVAYKTSSKAVERSNINKENARKKIYHHHMGSKGYAGCMPQWDALEEKFRAAGITPEPAKWNERARNWFYGHGGTLDAQGKALYNQRHRDNPQGFAAMLPIEKIRTSHKDVEEGRFVPDRENDELTRALGNDEHTGRARGTPGSKPWIVAFPPEKKRYPDKSHMRRKEREAAEKRAAADRLRNVEEAVLRLQQLSSQQGSGQSQPHIEAAIDSTGAPSNKKSSVASTQLQDGADDAMAPLVRYPVDYITEGTACELKLQVHNLKVTVAVGMAIPITENPRWHCRPVPLGYAVVTVDDVMQDWQQLKLDHPAGEDRELTELGEVRGGTAIWPKEHIHLPNYVPPRPPTPQRSNPPSPPQQHSPAPQPPSPPQQHSPAPQPSPPPQPPSPPQQHSPAQPSPPPPQPSPPPRQPSPSPEAQSQKRKRTTAKVAKRGSSSSSKRFRSPLPEVPHKNMKKRPGEMTAEELDAAAKADVAKWKIDMANKKKPKEPLFPRTPEDHAACVGLVKQLHDPLRQTPDYERSITKSAEAKERKVGKEVALLGQQKKQSVEPLKVYSTREWRAPPAGQYDPNNDPELIEQYGEKANLYGLSITEYMRRMDEFDTGTGPPEIAYQYRHGEPLVKHESMIKNLPTKMRRLHNWYMKACAEEKNWIYAKFKQEHYAHDGFVLIEFPELFQFYQGDALDKTLVSAYCL